jgi:hypothetical protein
MAIDPQLRSKKTWLNLHMQKIEHTHAHELNDPRDLALPLVNRSP